MENYDYDYFYNVGYQAFVDGTVNIDIRSELPVFNNQEQEDAFLDGWASAASDACE